MSSLLTSPSVGLRSSRLASSALVRTLASLTHIDAKGRPSMVDVGMKSMTRREAQARCRVVFPMQTMQSVTQFEGKKELISKKGPVFSTAIVAGVMGAKKTSELLPFCHPISLDDCQIDIQFDQARRNEVIIDCVVRVHHRTGVEMEALTGASMAALCIYDMCKATSHEILIKDLQLISKSGGQRDIWRTETITDVWPREQPVTSRSASSSSSSPGPSAATAAKHVSVASRSLSSDASSNNNNAQAASKTTTKQHQQQHQQKHQDEDHEEEEESRSGEKSTGRSRAYTLDYAI